jgi:hypothetical protein
LLGTILQQETNNNVLSLRNAPLLKQLASLIHEIENTVELDSFDQKVASAWQCLDDSFEEDGSSISDKDRNEFETFEICELCDAPIEWRDYQQGACNNGHKFG